MATGVPGFLGKLIYQTEVDAGGVDRGLAGLESKVKAAIDRLEHEDAVIELKAERKQLDAELKEAQAELKKFDGSEYQAELELGTRQFDAKFREAQLKAAQLEAKRIDVTLRMDSRGQFSRDARRVVHDAENVDNAFTSIARKITSARVNIGPFTLTLRAMVPVLGTLAPLIADLVGGIVALGSSLASAAAGGIAVASAGFAGLALTAGGAVLAIKPLITDFKTASAAAAALRTAQLRYGKSSDEAKEAAEKLRNTVKGMPPEATKAATAWERLKAAFASRTQSVRGDFFSILADGIKTAQALLPSFTRNVDTAFAVAARGVREWLEGLRSPEAQNLMDNIMGNFTRSLPRLLHGLGQFGTAFARIVSAASDFLPSFTRGFDEVGTDFANATEDGERLGRVIGGMADQTHAWFDLLGATGRLFATVITGGAAAGQDAVEDLTQTLDRWNDELSTAAGNRAMHDFFSQSVTGSEQLFSMLRRLLTLLFDLSRATAPFARGVLTIVNALGDVVHAAVQLRPVRALLAGIGAAMATAFVATKVIAFVTALRGIPRAITAVVTAFRAGTIAINPLLGILSLAAGAFAAFAVEAGGAKSALDRVKDAQHRANTEAHAAVRAVRAERDAYRELRTAALDLAQSHLDVKQARMALTAATHRANAIEDKYGKGSRKSKQAVLDQKQAEIDLRYAKRSVTEASQRETQASQKSNREYSKSIDKRKQVVATLHEQRNTIKSEIDVIQAEIDRQGTANARMDDGTRAGDDLADMHRRLRQNTKDLNDAQSKLNDRVKDGTKLFGFLQGPQGMGGAQRQSQSMEHQTGQLQNEMRNLGRTLGGVGNVSHGMGSMIGQVTNKILGSFGAKTLNFSLPAISSLVGSILQKGGTVGEQHKAAGGFTVPGSGDGDKFHTALPPGSFVMNRRASFAYGLQSGGMPVALEAGERVFTPRQVKAIGGDILHSMNRSVPRFAKGGGLDFALGPYTVPPVEYDPAHAGSNSHVHISATSIPWLIGVGHKIQQMGNSVGEFQPTSSGNPFHFGPVTTSAHAHYPTDHYSGHAVDVNSLQGAESKSWVASIAKVLSGGAAATTAKIKRLIVKGPPGPARDALQGQADTLRDAANTYIRQHQPRAAMGEAAVGPGALSRNEMRKLLKAHGMPDIMGWVAQAESGFNPHAVNPGSGAFGLWQDLPSTWAGLGVGGDRWDPNVQATGNAKLYQRDGLSPWQASIGGWGSHQGEPFQEGGLLGSKPHHHGLPGHQVLRLPPKPRKNKRHDYGTGPGSWYDWFGRAIDFYEGRGDTRSDAGKLPQAKSDWKDSLRSVIDEEHQIKRIIHHDKRRIHALDHRRLPKHLRKSEPSHHFNFRKRHKGESAKQYHSAKQGAKKAWHQRRKEWQREVKDFKQLTKQRQRGIKQELPDLFQQLRVDLPTRYNEIREKITGQAADLGLEQTASGQERYEALTEFGGNFKGLGFGVAAPQSRFGTQGARATGGEGRLDPTAFGVAAPSMAKMGARAAGAGGGGSVTHNKNVTVHNHYKTMPSDPHTWSAGVRHELGALT